MEGIMSADNLIAIQRIGDWYYVWHESASNECPMPSVDSYKTLNPTIANVYAKQLCEECMIVEYGIVKFPEVDNEILWFADILRRQTEWIFDMLMEIRYLARELNKEE